MNPNLDSALSNILNTVVSPDDLDELLEKACRELASIEGYDQASIALYDMEQKAFVERVVCESKSGDEFLCSKGRKHIDYTEENLLGQAVMHSLPYAHETKEDSSTSEVVLPLSSRENLIGALSILSGDEDRFHEEDFEKLIDYGRILSVAIENRILSSSGQDFKSRDTLTGLFSQRYLRARISHEIDRVDRFGGVFSLAIVEIDRFVEFRKIHGYHMASEVLKEVSRQIAENLREVDVAARYGEKEFAVVLPHADCDHALLAAKRIQELVKSLAFDSTNGQEMSSLTASVGMAVYPDDSPFKDGLLEAADMALSRAKERGVDQIGTYAQLAEEQGILSKE